MKEQFSFNLRDDNGAWIATCKAPGFVFTKPTEESAIEEALARWIRHLKTESKYAKEKPRVDRVEALARVPMKKFGGRPIVDKTPHKAVFASVEV